MVGFDIREGRPVPRFDGVVVCLEAAPMLLEAAGKNIMRVHVARALLPTVPPRKLDSTPHLTRNAL